jgi:hypothetical protein
MNCPYCNIPLNIDIMKNKIKISTSCAGCNIMLTYEEGELVKTTLIVEASDLTYYIVLDYKKNQSIISGPSFPNFEREMNKINSNHTVAWKRLFTFNYIMNINPQNAATKLKTILCFS